MHNRDPFDLFAEWYSNATKNEVEGNAMTLSTAALDGQPSSRTVLLSEFSHENGFIFYTDYTSRKATDMAVNPKVSLLFYWPKDYLQVRIEGIAQKTSAEVSDKYFYQRAKEKQLSATLSHQSARLESIESLRDEYAAQSQNLADRHIERPVTWGGYQVFASRFEFWTGSRVRLHTRIVFEKDEQGEWVSYYIQP